MNKLRDYMAKKGLTQKELADQLDVSQPTVSEWLSGKIKPSAGRLVKISKKTGMSIDELLRGSAH